MNEAYAQGCNDLQEEVQKYFKNVLGGAPCPDFRFNIKEKNNLTKKPTYKISPDSFGSILMTIRKKGGLTQQKLASEIKSTQGLITRIESGKNVNLSTICKILDVFGLNLVIALDFDNELRKEDFKEKILEEKIIHKKRIKELKEQLKSLDSK